MNKAFLNFTDRYFSIGHVEFKASLQFSMEINGKAIPYKYMFTNGVDYDYLGEGEVTINLKILAQSWDNIGNDRVNDINKLRWLMIGQIDNHTKVFVHPELPPVEIFIKKMGISEDNSDYGFTIDLQCVKVTTVNSVREVTQDLVEKEYESKVDDGEFVYSVIQGDTLWGIAQKYLGDGKLYKKLWEYKDNSSRNMHNTSKMIYKNVPADCSISDILRKVDTLNNGGSVQYKNQEEQDYIAGIIAGTIIKESEITNDPNLIYKGDTFLIPKTLS